MAKQILFHADARRAIKTGMDVVADAVKVTIGPRGRNIALDKGYGSPTITNDGVSIAKEISLKDKFENMGAEIVKEVASKTNEKAGDGTTTATVLVQAIVNEGLKYVESGLEVMAIKHGIERATNDVVDELKKMSKPISTPEETKQVATISAESEELGAIIAETIEKVGKEGVVTVEESRGTELTSDVVEGMSFDKGYVSAYMVSDTERMEAIVESAPVLITDAKISSIKVILPILEKLSQTGRKDLVIIADDVTGEALATFVLNKIRGSLNVVAIKSPGFGDRKKELLDDIATMVGATVVSEEKGMKLDEQGLEVLGKADRIVVKKDETIIVGGKGSQSDIQSRVGQLKALMTNTDSVYDKEKFQERIAKMTGGIAVIRVGAATETEMKYLKLKIEDAVNATKAALEEGIVAGGGSALIKAAQAVQNAKKEFVSQEEEMAYKIVCAACEAPLKQIAINGGKGDGSMVVYKVQEMLESAGYDARNDMFVDDMVSAGIIDPVKVTRNALLNAASAAGTFLTTDVAIVEEPEEKPQQPMGMGGMEY
ncbi:MAG TPA: chaperonin GroEL [Candidatus Paceibacterota bacterium]